MSDQKVHFNSMKQPTQHMSDHDLERYYLGMVKDEAELASVEEHLLACRDCAERAESTQDYVDALRSALVMTRED